MDILVKSDSHVVFYVYGNIASTISTYEFTTKDEDKAKCYYRTGVF